MTSRVVLRLSDVAAVRETLGHAPDTIRRLALTEGAPVRVRGEGKGRREFVVVDEFVMWLKANSRLLV
jgi:hypothetical protein